MTEFLTPDFNVELTTVVLTAPATPAVPAPEPATTTFVILSSALVSISILETESSVFSATASISLLITSVLTVAPTLTPPAPDAAPLVTNNSVSPVEFKTSLSPAISPFDFLPLTRAFDELLNTRVSTAPETADAPEPVPAIVINGLEESPTTSLAADLITISALAAEMSELLTSALTLFVITPVIIEPPTATAPAPAAEPVRPTTSRLSFAATTTPLSPDCALGTVVVTLEFDIFAVISSEETIVFTEPVIAPAPEPAPPATVESILLSASALTLILPWDEIVELLISALDFFDETKVFTPPLTAAAPEPLA